MIGQRAVEVEFTCTVASGVGTVFVPLPASNGCMIYVSSIRPPGPTAFNWILRNTKNYPMDGGNNVSGEVASLNQIPARLGCYLSFSSAADGVYTGCLQTLWGS